MTAQRRGREQTTLFELDEIDEPTFEPEPVMPAKGAPKGATKGAPASAAKARPAAAEVDDGVDDEDDVEASSRLAPWRSRLLAGLADLALHALAAAAALG